MRKGEREARIVIQDKLQWRAWGQWHYEFPLAASFHKDSGLPGGPPRRADAVCPTAQVLVEVKSDAADIDVPGTYQADNNMHLLYHARGIGGTWWAIVTDGHQCRRRRYFIGEPISAWETVTPFQIESDLHIPHNQAAEAFNWMAQGLRLTYHNGMRFIECLTCKEEKPISHYHKDAGRRYGFNNRCAVCENKRRRREREKCQTNIS